jgi:hypothetical protein
MVSSVQRSEQRVGTAVSTAAGSSSSSEHNCSAQQLEATTAQSTAGGEHSSVGEHRAQLARVAAVVSGEHGTVVRTVVRVMAEQLLEAAVLVDRSTSAARSGRGDPAPWHPMPEALQLLASHGLAPRGLQLGLRRSVAWLPAGPIPWRVCAPCRAWGLTPDGPWQSPGPRQRSGPPPKPGPAVRGAMPEQGSAWGASSGLCCARC